MRPDTKERQLSGLEEQQNLVPPSAKERMYANILDALNGFPGQAGVQKASAIIAAELLRGNISVDVAKEVRGFLELTMTSIAAENIQRKPNAPITLSATIAEARRSAQTRELPAIERRAVALVEAPAEVLYEEVNG